VDFESSFKDYLLLELNLSGLEFFPIDSSYSGIPTLILMLLSISTCLLSSADNFLYLKEP